MAKALTTTSLFEKYRSTIQALPKMNDDAPPMSAFRLWEVADRGLACFYSPFEYVNSTAKIVLVGITPGGTQMNRALNAARDALARGVDVQGAIRKVKREGSFSGSMRANIVNTLNRLGYPKRLGIDCSSQLWDSHDHLVHFCSFLKFPVFLNGKGYNGTPKPLEVRELRELVINEFVTDLKLIDRQAELIPLGDTVADIVVHLRRDRLIPQKVREFEGRIVAPPHPSGANNESIDLLMKAKYPDISEYKEQMYQEYLRKAPWTKKQGGHPQPEDKYKAVRASRWESILFLRRAYGLN